MNIGSNIATQTDRPATASAHRTVPGRPTRPYITVKNILWQVRSDIATKEVQTSPTYSYQWMADQVGHMAVGMAVVLLFWPFGGIWPVIGFTAVVIGASLLELWDYRQACAKIKLPFNATCDRKDLRQNASIAVYYMALGGFFALSALMLNKLPTSLPVIVRVVVMFFVFAIAIVGPAFYWLRQKIRFQQIGLPFLFRLPEFKLLGIDFKTHPIDPEAIKWIATAKWIDDEFINGDGEGKHIAIVGSLNSGKTSLAVGIATEGSFSGKKARYLTFDKLQQIGLNHEPPPPRNTKLWPWQHSQLLIIDDVTAGIAEGPKQLLQALEKLGSVRERLRERNTVWCLGADVSDVKPWIETLKVGCGIDPKKLLTVTLKSPEKSPEVEGKKDPEGKNIPEGSIGYIHGEVPPSMINHVGQRSAT